MWAKMISKIEIFEKISDTNRAWNTKWDIFGDLSKIVAPPLTLYWCVYYYIFNLD